MKLDQYLRQNEIKPVAFAASIDVPPSTITRLIRGERKPGAELIAKIKRGTAGAVTADDFVPELAE